MRSSSLPTLAEIGGKAAIIQLKCLTLWPGGAVLWGEVGTWGAVTSCVSLAVDSYRENACHKIHRLNQRPLLSLQSVIVRNWFGAGGDGILSLSFPTLRALRRVERGNVGERKGINQRAGMVRKAKSVPS